MNWLEALTDDLKQEQETLLESSEGLKRLDNDFKEHCKISHDFISNNYGVHDPKVILRALELAFGIEEVLSLLAELKALKKGE